MEEKRAVYAPPRAKSKRNIIILAVLAALLLIILAIVIPVYFTVIKPNSNKISASDTPGSTAKPSPTITGAPTVAAVVTGGDGSKVTMDDGTTFTYHNPFGGYWYWDENDPFNNSAKAQTWSPSLNETFRYGIDKIRG